MCKILQNENIELIAGDDITLSVEFFFSDGKPVEFGRGDSAEILIHDGEFEKSIPVVKTDGNTATFYLSSDFTNSLLKDEKSKCYYDYCVRVNWSSGGRCTPIYRKTLIVKRC